MMHMQTASSCHKVEEKSGKVCVWADEEDGIGRDEERKRRGCVAVVAS